MLNFTEIKEIQVKTAIWCQLFSLLTWQILKAIEQICIYIDKDMRRSDTFMYYYGNEYLYKYIIPYPNPFGHCFKIQNFFLNFRR